MAITLYTLSINHKYPTLKYPTPFVTKNQMPANPIKFQLMHTSKNEDVEFECRNIKIESEESAKLLGINIDNMLKFTQHVSNNIRKCGFQLNTLRRQLKLLNTKIKLMIFYSFIQANLNYCPLI